MHRALVSLMEELEAIDWYQQRADACTNSELKSVLMHNMHEEMEHAAMLLEWIRRGISRFDGMLRKYLFRDGALADLEKHAPAGRGGAPCPHRDFSETSFDRDVLRLPQQSGVLRA